jgi:hypothetical protein
MLNKDFMVIPNSNSLAPGAGAGAGVGTGFNNYSNGNSNVIRTEDDDMAEAIRLSTMDGTGDH